MPRKEPRYAVIWRTIKILKHFSLDDLEMYTNMTHDIRRAYIRDYVNGLIRAGFVGRRQERFSLLKNAPTAPAAHVLNQKLNENKELNP